MSTNTENWASVERGMPVIIGIGEGLLGLALIAIASLASPLSIPLPLWSLGVLSDLGIGLLAAGIITGTLEPISRKRLQRDIEQIREAHFETMLKGLMPEPIFEEVQAHIIREPFLRRNFRVVLELSWTDETREYLHKSQIISYEVENASRTLERYGLRVWEERANEDRFPGSTRIQEIQVQPYDGKQPSVYVDTDLDDFIEKTPQDVRALIPVMLEPGERARVVTRVRSVMSSRDVYFYAVTNSTVQLALTLAHPSDLSAQAMPMHPSQRKFMVEADTPTLKCWRIEAGLLPFQGIQLTWHPIPLLAQGQEQ